MGKFDDSEGLDLHSLGGNNYGYSAAPLNSLTAPEYTLVTLVNDESGSTSGFVKPMESAVKEIMKACRHSPRSDYLLVRMVNFGSTMREIHGFKLLEQTNLSDYDGFFGAGGSTALFDTSKNAIDATADYAKQLTENDYSVNAIVFVITDGDDVCSKYSANDVGESLKKCITGETMESLVSVLIGVNITDPMMKNRLDDFAQKAGFTKFIPVDDASEKTLAKLADFVSKSISSQSQALGSGGPSQALNSLTI
jgi:hypothetical protein